MIKTTTLLEREGIFKLELSEDKKQLDFIDEAELYICSINKTELGKLREELKELFFKMKT